MPPDYARRMDIVPIELGTAAAAARDRLTDLSRDAARASAASTAVPAPSNMAGAAREAVFADALLAALHARFEELKGVAK